MKVALYLINLQCRYQRKKIIMSMSYFWGEMKKKIIRKVKLHD